MTIAATLGAAIMAPFMLFGGGGATVTHHTPDTSPSSSVHQSASCTMLDTALYYGESDRGTNGQITKLQAFLYANGYLSSKSTGFYGLATIKAVKQFQSDHNIQATGYVGAQTRAQIKVASCDNNNGGNNGGGNSNQPLRISGIDAPAALMVGATGTWTVNVKENSANALHYSVVWGDENANASALARSANAIRTSSTFTHTYANAGVYTPTFTVSDDHGNTVTKSVSVTVSTENTVSIASISPTAAAAGAKVTVTGTGFTANSALHFNGSSITPTVNSSTTLSFTVPSVGAGRYDVAVDNENGTSNVVTFTVLAASTSLSISGVDAPVALTVGQAGTWTVHVNSSASSNLHYAVTWGDEGNSPMRMNAAATVSSSGTFTHTYNAKGAYAPKFTITDDAGHTVSVSTTVAVRAN